MRTKAIWALLVMVLLMGISYGAWAAPGDATLFPQAQDGTSVDSAQSVAAVGDTLYILGQNGLYAWKAGDEKPSLLSDQVKAGFLSAKWEDMSLEDQETNKNNVNLLLQCDGKLYGLNTLKGSLLLLDASQSGLNISEAFVLDWEGMSVQEADYFYTRQIFGAALTRDHLYLLTQPNSDDWNNYVLLSFDLVTGVKAEMPVKNVHAIAAYQNGQLLCNVYDWESTYTADGKVIMPVLSVLDPITGMLTRLTDFPYTQVGGLCYDAEKNMVYVVGKGQLYGAKPGSEFETVAYLPVDFPSEQMSATIMSGGLYAVSPGYSAVYVRNTDPALKSDRVLRIAGGYSDTVSQAFQAANTSIPVIFMDQYFSSAEEISQNMVSGSDSADLFLLSLSYGGFTSLRDKGYVTDLSQNTVLTDAVAKMYPQYVQAIFKDDRLIAFPYQLNTSAIGYSPDILQEIGLSQPPKTLIELMDLYVDWVEEYSTEFPNYAISENIYDVRMELLNTIFMTYLSHYAKTGEELAFDTPVFRTLLSKLDEVTPILKELNPSEEDRQNGMVTYSNGNGMTPTALFTNITLNPQDYNEARGYQPLLLSLDEGMEPACFAQMQVFVVNPNSKNQDLAIQYLEYYTQNMPRAVSITLCPDDNTPVENPNSQNEIDELKKQVESLKGQLATAKPEEVKSLEETLKSQEEYLAWQEANRFIISQSVIDQYRTLVPYIFVDTENLNFLTSSPEALTLLQRFMQGEMDTQQFVKEFDRKLQMMRMEGY